MARVEAAKAVSSTWARTLASYKKELPVSDLALVQKIASPNDVAKHVEDLETKRHASKSGAFADRIHAITGRLTQFGTVIGAMTSSNLEASLIWGSLKLLLTIVHRSAEEYEKICQSVLSVCESFPTVELLAITFDRSDLVCTHISAFYTSVLQFWSKALRFHRGRRIFNLVRAWHDFESEFGDLDRDMKRHGERIEKGAAAVHMHEAKTARLEQISVNTELLEAARSIVRSDRHREIVQWLAPSNHEANYFSDDLKSAQNARHSGTCMWILDRPKFKAWLDSDSQDHGLRLLWISGIPGAGKTVLSFFVIDQCLATFGNEPSPSVLYFFFKETDADKNSILSVTPSLVYQLYTLFPSTLSEDIAFLRDNSGKDRALNDQRLWELFVKHVQDKPNLTIVLDALDECNDADILLRRIFTLLNYCPARVLVVSRREENITLMLEQYPSYFIGQEDIGADIHSYVTAEVGKIPRFRGKSIQHKIVTALSSEHGGMFLWAYLMIKELKELGTVRQVDEALRRLPQGLEKMHEMIITRLNSTLHKAHRQLAIKILTWIVCAIRPLRLEELQEVLRFELQKDVPPGQSWTEADDLLYSSKDIELACGALVTYRNGTLQLIHLSTKEILLQRPLHMLPDDSLLAFFVDAQNENPRMATFCVSYLSTCLRGIDSVTRPNLAAASRLHFTKEEYHLTGLLENSPLIEYASNSWQVHLIDGKISSEVELTLGQLQELLTYDLTMIWIELYVTLRRDNIWTLERHCNLTMSWAKYELFAKGSKCHEQIRFLWAWSNAVVSILTEYGRVIENYPYELHHLDLRGIVNINHTPYPSSLPAYFIATDKQNLRESLVKIDAVNHHQPGVRVEPCKRLQRNVNYPDDSRLAVFLYDDQRKVYYTAEWSTPDGNETIWAQEEATGRRLEPARAPSDCSSPIYLVVGAVLSHSRSYFAILYQKPTSRSGREFYLTTIWAVENQLDFQDVKQRRPWARRVHHLETSGILFSGSCCPLTAGRNGFFYCPSGEVDPQMGIRKSLPANYKNRFSRISDDEILAFAGNGQTLIRLVCESSVIEQTSWLEDESRTKTFELLSLTKQESKVSKKLQAVSQTGRFIVYEIRFQLVDLIVSYLVDTRAKGPQKLQTEISDTKDTTEYTRFYFSDDEKSLLKFSITGTDQ